MAARVKQCVQHMIVLFFICLCPVQSKWNVKSESNNITKTCPELYINGVEAYLDERWEDCINYFENAVKEYKSFRQNTVQCRLKCEYEANSTPPIFSYEIEHLQFYEKLVKKTLCLLKCKNMYFNNIPHSIPKGAEKVFSELKPYEYLQLCYYQNHELQKAASASFTFLVANPTHETMLRNLKFYSTLPEVDMEQVENFEAMDYVSLYIHGSDAYSKENYKSVINYIEESLEDYLGAEEECRAYCEGPFDQGWFPDYTSSVAIPSKSIIQKMVKNWGLKEPCRLSIEEIDPQFHDAGHAAVAFGFTCRVIMSTVAIHVDVINDHFTFCLRCKRKCPHKLNSLNGERHDDLLPSHYHFLQYAYYKVGNLKKACQAVESYLLFFPADETMLSNKKYYMNVPKGDKSLFSPREEALKYVQRQEYEYKLLEYIEMEFTFKDVNKEPETPL